MSAFSHTANFRTSGLSGAPVHKSSRPFCTRAVCSSRATQQQAAQRHTQSGRSTQCNTQGIASQLVAATLALSCCLGQPRPALADLSTSMPPSTSSSTSTAAETASRTVVDIVSGENSLLTEENAPDNRERPTKVTSDTESDKHKDPQTDIDEVRRLCYLYTFVSAFPAVSAVVKRKAQLAACNQQYSLELFANKKLSRSDEPDNLHRKVPGCGT